MNWSKRLIPGHGLPYPHIRLLTTKSPNHVILNGVKDLNSMGASSSDVSLLRLAQHDSL
jgi:hypothetical protein